MTRRLVARVVPVALIASLLAGPARSQPAVPDSLRAFSIIPPGQDGSLTVLDLFEGGGPYVQDQLDAYAALPDDPQITDAELGTYFHSFGFGPEGGTAGPPVCPSPGVCIYRDTAHGIPHVYATGSLSDAAYGLGWVTAQDRMWEADVFRHVARGDAAAFLGPDFLDSDVATRRDGYTEAEVQAMLDDLSARHGPVGQQIEEGVAAYTLGINDAVADPGFRLPVEYGATGNTLEPWEATDTMYIAILQLRALGETAGAELHNAAVLQHLQKRLGKRRGLDAFEDLLFQNQRRSPTTVPGAEGAFPSQPLGKTKKGAVAIPDQARALAARDGSERRAVERVHERLGLRWPASNALLVGPGESTTGNPLHIGAPQVGYAVPSFFMDIDVHVSAEGIHFRGPGIPGAAVLVPLGRGADWAWSLTTGVSDAVDVRVERLCDPAGGPATATASGVLFNGTCRPMSSRTETIAVKGGAPLQQSVFRTSHGPVFARGTVKGDPVALVRERFFWMREVDSIVSVFRWNADADTVQEFADAASGFTMSFNAHYVNADHIAYYHLGSYPLRPAGVHPSLPSWGTGQWEWQGRFPFASHPQIVDPKQGWLANWNNKPSRGWDSMDTFKWGSVNRVELIQDHVARLAGGGNTIDLAELVQVMADAATRDMRAYALGRRMVRWADREPSNEFAGALRMVRRWLTRGGHRQNLDRDGLMDHGAALAVFDRWYDTLVHRIFDDELGRGFYDLGQVPPITDYSPTGGSSFWFDFSSYVADLFRGGKGYSLDYCDDTDTRNRQESCRDQVVAALRAGLKREAAEQRTSNVRRWRTTAENLEFQELGGLSVPAIPWQNRGTHNHVVEVLNDV
jgi:acyl-homoserine lactone acylase PvdQ